MSRITLTQPTMMMRVCLNIIIICKGGEGPVQRNLGLNISILPSQLIRCLLLHIHLRLFVLHVGVPDLRQQVLQLFDLEHRGLGLVLVGQRDLDVPVLLPQVRRQLHGVDLARAVPHDDDGVGGVEGDVVQSPGLAGDNSLDTNWFVDIPVKVVDVDFSILKHEEYIIIGEVIGHVYPPV